LSIETDPHQKRMIRALFTRIAARYDRVNRMLSFGQDQRWRRAALAVAAIPPDGWLLDVATGTGDMALTAAELPAQPHVIGTDLTMAMLRQAQAKADGHRIPFLVSDGLALAHADNSFDVVTSAFMMRNVPNIAQAFSEQVRVLRPGGRVVCLEMTWPERFPVSWLFGIYFFGIAPLLGRVTAGVSEPYRYLPRSVKQFVKPDVLADVMTRAGLQQVTWRSLMLGTVTIHVGTKPDPNRGHDGVPVHAGSTA
jgi:demethylmenaquinone methyltransferase/2-methoxy-6-polyprenyl-1,4-benzoquinol methylase